MIIFKYKASHNNYIKNMIVEKKKQKKTDSNLGDRVDNYYNGKHEQYF
jgi:hypothetical protein